jgi:hypothetical protein
MMTKEKILEYGVGGVVAVVLVAFVAWFYLTPAEI